MKIGIKFQVPNEWGNLIENILFGINLKQYVWKINEDEVYTEDNIRNNGFLFPQEKAIFSNIEFEKIISYPSYYTVFANIQAYINENDISNIETYGDFKKSKCQFIILITDNIFVNVYAKSENILEQIMKNAILNKYQKVEYITNDQDKTILL